jgi:hypothetical protein
MMRFRLHVDLRLVSAAAAALVAGVVVLALTRPPSVVEVLTAAAPLPPGVPLADLPLEVASVHDRAGAVLAVDLDEILDRVLVAPLGAGDPILESLVAPPVTGGRDVIGLTLRPERAVHGDLVAGDTVAVYAMRDDFPPLRLATAVPVLAASSDVGGLGSSDVAVLLAVDHRLAAQLIRAVGESGIYLVRVGR